MKIIFIKDLKKQGKSGDIKEVSDGYATNYLIKNGYAVKYTKTSNERLNEDIKNKALKEKKDIANANTIKEKLSHENIIFEVKAGKDGKTFGNISTKQIEEKLTSLGYSIDKKKIKPDNTLNLLGAHYVKIELHKKVTGEVKITIKEK